MLKFYQQDGIGTFAVFFEERGRGGDRTRPLSQQQHASLTVPFSLRTRTQLHEPLPEGRMARSGPRSSYRVQEVALECDGVVRPPSVFTFKLTRLPKGYPTGFKFPPGVEPNLADYEDRCERCLLTYPPLPTQDAVSFFHRLVLLRVVGQQLDQAL